MAATIEKAGQRLYALDTPYTAKDKLKSVGCKWDPDRRAWWIGAKKAEALEQVVAEINGVITAPEAAASVGLKTSAPAFAVADKLRDEGRDEEADAVQAKAVEPVKPVREDPNNIRLTGKGRYKGREYYAGAITRDGLKVRLLTLPDARGDYLDFWVACSEVEQTKRYDPREVWDGRRYSGKTVTKYMTLGDIARFIRRQSNPDTARGQCTECDHWGPRGETCTECHEGTHQ